MRVEMMGQRAYRVTAQACPCRLDCLKRKKDSIVTTAAVWAKDHHSKVAIEDLGNRMNIGLRVRGLAILRPSLHSTDWYGVVLRIRITVTSIPMKRRIRGKRSSRYSYKFWSSKI